MEFNIDLHFTLNAENETEAKQQAIEILCMDKDFIQDNLETEPVQDDDLLKLKGYVLTSAYREKVIEALNTNQYGLIPKQIAKECNVRPNHISKTLSELVNVGLIRCINPEMRKGRIYQLTTKGEELQGLI